jgi:hypothetical protein
LARPDTIFAKLGGLEKCSMMTIRPETCVWMTPHPRLASLR